jgi:hypothetical protein
MGRIIWGATWPRENVTLETDKTMRFSQLCVTSPAVLPQWSFSIAKQFRSRTLVQKFLDRLSAGLGFPLKLLSSFSLGSEKQVLRLGEELMNENESGSLPEDADSFCK